MNISIPMNPLGQPWHSWLVGLALIVFDLRVVLGEQPPAAIEWKAAPKVSHTESDTPIPLPKNLVDGTPSGHQTLIPVGAQTPSEVRTPTGKPLSNATAEIRPAAPLAPTIKTGLTLEEAVRQTLANNPQLAAIRQQSGIAAAAVVIARTYPYNPITQSYILGVTGPQSAGITNQVFNQHKIFIDVELRGQRHFRKQTAFATVTRTEWEIAVQEVLMAVNTVRAFDALIYRQAKLALTEEFLKLNQKGTEQVKDLVGRGVLRPADLILARAEVNDIQSQIGLHRTALITARRDFSRVLGGTDLAATANGTMDRSAPRLNEDQFLETALEHRPDLFARQAAIREAEGRLKLQIADRWGNPTVGPFYELNETRANFIGLQFGAPIPVFNRRQGEIKQREAERLQAILNLQQTETEIRQDAIAAVARVNEARNWVERYQKEILPDLQKSLDEMDKLFQLGQAGVDVLRVLDVRRKLLRAQDGYLDALLGYTQALADMAQAAGDPAMAMGIYQSIGTIHQPKTP